MASSANIEERDNKVVEKTVRQALEAKEEAAVETIEGLIPEVIIDMI